MTLETRRARGGDRARAATGTAAAARPPSKQRRELFVEESATDGSAGGLDREGRTTLARGMVSIVDSTGSAASAASATWRDGGTRGG